MKETRENRTKVEKTRVEKTRVARTRVKGSDPVKRQLPPAHHPAGIVGRWGGAALPAGRLA